MKFDVTWSYVKRQTAKMTSEFVFFSSNPSLNHIKIEKCLLLFATNTNIFTLLFKELKTDGQSFIFAVCRLTYDHVTWNVISHVNAPQFGLENERRGLGRRWGWEGGIKNASEGVFAVLFCLQLVMLKFHFLQGQYGSWICSPSCLSAKKRLTNKLASTFFT